MFFKDVIGQEKAKAFLRRSADEDRIPHARIFLGRKGSGTLAASLAFAQYVMCEDKKDGESCGVCPHCRKAEKMIHPDIHFSYPTVGSKAVSTMFSKEWRAAVSENPYLNLQQWLTAINAENKQGNITKDECVDIVKKLSLKTFEGNYKILIMWLPEFLGKEGNRLLKLIEEPPENTLFMLIAEDAEKILNTILSRCQVVQFTPLSDEEVKNALTAKGVEAGKAEQIAHLANGDLNEALTLIDESDNDNALLFLQWLRMCYLGKPSEVVEWSNKFASIGRENQKHFFDYGLFFLREYMILKLTGNERVRLNENELKTAKNLTRVIEPDQIEPMSKILTESAFHISRNANPKIMMTEVSVSMNRLLRRKPALV